MNDMAIDLDSIDLSNFDENSISQDYSEGWRKIVINSFGEPTPAKDGKPGINIKMYYTGIGKGEKSHNIHLNPANSASYAINVEMIATMLSNAVSMDKKTVLAMFKSKEISLSAALKKCVNLEVNAYCAKQKDNIYLEIKRFLGYGETPREPNKKPASPVKELDLPF